MVLLVSFLINVDFSGLRFTIENSIRDKVNPVALDKNKLPLTKQAKAELIPLLSNSPYVLSSTKGRVSLDPGTVSNAVTTISKEMVAAGVRNEYVIEFETYQLPGSA